MLRVNIRFINHTLDDRRQLQTLVDSSAQAVILLDDSAGAAGGGDVGKETSKVQTHPVSQLSQEGCSFSSSSPEGLTPGAQLRTRVVADGTVLAIQSRVVHVAREG
jgi:hypothetical protein